MLSQPKIGKTKRRSLDVDAASLLNAIGNERDRLHNNNVRLRCIGDCVVAERCAKCFIRDAMTMTQRNTGLTLILALSCFWTMGFDKCDKSNCSATSKIKTSRRVKFRKNLFRNIFQPERNIPIPI